MGRRLRVAIGLLALIEIVGFILVASWIGVGWTILLTLATSVLGWVLLARQGVRALAELRERARSRRPAGRELGDAGLIAVGGLLMVLPGFVGDVIGLLCLLPITRPPHAGRAWPGWRSPGCPTTCGRRSASAASAPWRWTGPARTAATAGSSRW